MRKTLKINQTFYYSIHNEVLKWRNFLVMYVQNRTPYWSPILKADKEKLEKVQRRAINTVSGLKGKTYEDKLT